MADFKKLNTRGQVEDRRKFVASHPTPTPQQAVKVVRPKKSMAASIDHWVLGQREK